MNEMGAELNSLDEETQQLINNQITDNNKFKEVKEKAIKEIGEAGAKRKWTSLFNKAKALLAKAKNNASEKIKKDIKKIQNDLARFKSGTNSYLNNVYKQNKNDAAKLENDLSNFSTANQTVSPNKETP
jgi:hypothetical protein